MSVMQIYIIFTFLVNLTNKYKLERLFSEDTHHRLMITHSIESYWIPSQKQTKS